MRAFWLLNLLMLATPAGATTLRALSLEELAARSHAVVEARVMAEHAEWRDGFIYTVTDVLIEKRLAGSATGGMIRVLQLGGTLGTEAMPVAGGASFAAGERVLLFLIRHAGSEFFLAGMSQGKLSRRPDDSWAWLPTAPTWDGKALKQPSLTRVTPSDLRRALRGRP